MRQFRFHMAFMTLAFLAGCDAIVGDSGVIHDRSNQYLASREGRPLVVPPNLSKEQISDTYAVTAVDGELGVNLAPPGSLAAESGLSRHSAALPILPAISEYQIKINTEGKQTSLVLDQSFTKAWTFIGSALQRRRLPILVHKRDLQTYFIADTFYTDDKITKDTPIRQVHLIDEGPNTRIIVLSNESKPLNPAIQKRLIEDLKLGLLGKRKKRFFGLV
jgi:uncharacterized lipoprotein